MKRKELFRKVWTTGVYFKDFFCKKIKCIYTYIKYIYDVCNICTPREMNFYTYHKKLSVCITWMNESLSSTDTLHWNVWWCMVAMCGPGVDLDTILLYCWGFAGFGIFNFAIHTQIFTLLCQLILILFLQYELIFLSI